MHRLSGFFGCAGKKVRANALLHFPGCLHLLERLRRQHTSYGRESLGQRSKNRMMVHYCLSQKAVTCVTCVVSVNKLASISSNITLFCHCAMLYLSAYLSHLLTISLSQHAFARAQLSAACSSCIHIFTLHTSAHLCACP